MKKLIFLTLLLIPIQVYSATPPTPAVVINSPDGRQQFYPKFSSITIGDLGCESGVNCIAGYHNALVTPSFSGVNLSTSTLLKFKYMTIAGDLYIQNTYTEPQ